MRGWPGSSGQPPPGSTAGPLRSRKDREWEAIAGDEQASKRDANNTGGEATPPPAADRRRAENDGQAEKDISKGGPERFDPIVRGGDDRHDSEPSDYDAEDRAPDQSIPAFSDGRDHDRGRFRLVGGLGRCPARTNNVRVRLIPETVRFHVLPTPKTPQRYTRTQAAPISPSKLAVRGDGIATTGPERGPTGVA